MLINNSIEKKDLVYITLKASSAFKTLSQKKILITGGAGFLGYYLVKSILFWNEVHSSQKIFVTVLDNFMLGEPPWIQELKQNPFFSLLKKNLITSPLNCNQEFNYIIHAASIASPVFYRKHQLETMDANIIGLRRVLEYAQRNKINGVLFFSSSEIYGDPPYDKIPTSENYRGNVSCIGPRACYDESKRYGETLCYVFANRYNIPIKIVRPFNNYGPGMKINDGRILADFSRAALENKNIIIHSDGSPTRTYCYVADAIIGYFLALIKGNAADPYNIGLAKPEISVLEVAKLVQKLAKKKFSYSGSVIEMKSNDSEFLIDNPNRRCPDISKAKKELGFSPAVSITQGVSQTLDWYKKMYYSK
ncbi:NAD-dependent dehydratase [Candidatus Roizmanbacteria bacterium CG11_big_fil_rev_8_21_14_0_20_36_8]|uniref:NAD-dependent dehydratase n=1 Tax=Candidatus Roizmanbacteria bacterium CG11_big_fil_rev_8_21_14_0_20_36_8 TaxID=1974856 RepID=A0A2M6IUB8_9BACT|nr:MAG: NAD-dependent dehydratase [Candidatus Roizmanbacteria bacterium CG11_big_fil_rev_8_21_14_0_20_36_8]